MGWALENLGSARCREIAEGIIRVEKVYGTKLHGFCPVHKPQETNASAFYNYELDSGSCKSCGEKWDLVKLWCLANSYDAQDLKAFREEFDSDYSGGARDLRKVKAAPTAKPTPAPLPAAPEVFVSETELEALPPLPPERVVELGKSRGWSAAVIEFMDLREFVDVKGVKRIALPIRTAAGELGNIRLYTPGADQFKIISWFDKLCTKCGGKFKADEKKKKICQKCGGSPNDYGRTRLYPSPSQWKPGVIWLVEGESDLLCALSQGLNAVTQTAGCGTWPDEFSSYFADRDVVVCFDADHPGFKGAQKAAESLIQVAKSVRIIVWPELMGVSVD